MCRHTRCQNSWDQWQWTRCSLSRHGSEEKSVPSYCRHSCSGKRRPKRQRPELSNRMGRSPWHGPTCHACQEELPRYSRRRVSDRYRQFADSRDSRLKHRYALNSGDRSQCDRERCRRHPNAPAGTNCARHPLRRIAFRCWYQDRYGRDFVGRNSGF